VWSAIVIPLALRQRVIEELRQGHSGVVRMKDLACSHFWWPGLDKEVEQLAKTCPACQSVKNAPIKPPLAPLGLANYSMAEGTHRFCRPLC